MVIIVARTALGTMHMITGRCVNKSRILDFEFAGLMKHWRWKGRMEVRRVVDIDIVTNELQNLALQRFTTLYSHTIGTADRQTELIVYDHSNNCQCDRTLCTTTPPFERLNNNQNQLECPFF